MMLSFIFPIGFVARERNGTLPLSGGCETFQKWQLGSMIALGWKCPEKSCCCVRSVLCDGVMRPNTPSLYFTTTVHRHVNFHFTPRKDLLVGGQQWMQQLRTIHKCNGCSLHLSLSCHHHLHHQDLRCHHRPRHRRRFLPVVNIPV